MSNNQKVSDDQKDPDVKFECQRCGDCCGLYCIPCTDNDMKRILDYLKLTTENVSDIFELVEPDEEVLYTYEDSPKILVEDIDSKNLVLVVKSKEEDKHCRFFDKERCSIYPARPLVCRFFPFVYEYKEDEETDLIDNPEGITFSVYEESTYCKGLNKGRKFEFDKLRETTVKTIKEDKEFEKKIKIWNVKFIFNQIKDCDEIHFLQFLLNFKD